MKPVLAVFSLADLNSPSSEGMIADKLDAYFLLGEKKGIEFSKALLPGNYPWFSRSPYKFLRLPGQAKFWFFSVTSFTLKLLGATSARKKILEMKSMNQKASWSKLIKLVNPKAVIGIGLPAELIEESSRLSIPALEIQHGTLTPNSLTSYFPEIKPTMILCWNNHTVETASSEGFSAKNVGHPMALNVCADRTPWSSTTFPKGKEVGSFCVALSWGVGNSEDPFGCMHSELRQSVQLLASLGHTPIFRIHPVISSKRIPSYLLKKWLQSKWPDSVVHDPRQAQIFKSASESNFLLAYESAAAIDFGILGKPSIILDPKSRSEVRLALSGVNSQFGFAFGSYEELINSQSQLHRRSSFEFSGVEELLNIMHARD